MDNTTDVLSALQNPEAMQKLMHMASELMGSASASAADSETSESADASAELMQRAIPTLSAIAQSGTAVNSDRVRLLSALKPFLSDSTGKQIDHAKRLLSMARMTKAAAEQFLPQQSGTKEG